MEHKTDTNNGVILITGLVSLLVLAFVLVWLNSYFYNVRNAEVYRKVLSAENPKLVELRSAESAKLTTYGWHDQEAGTVRLPIERAMEKMLQESRESGGD